MHRTNPESRRKIMSAILAALDAPRSGADAFGTYLHDVRAVAGAYLTTTVHGGESEAARAAYLGAAGARERVLLFLGLDGFNALSAACFGLREAGDILVAGELSPDEVDAVLADLDAARVGLPEDSAF